jgi:hypothetical protein
MPAIEGAAARGARLHRLVSSSRLKLESAVRSAATLVKMQKPQTVKKFLTHKLQFQAHVVEFTRADPAFRLI